MAIGIQSTNCQLKIGPQLLAARRNVPQMVWELTVFGSISSLTTKARVVHRRRAMSHGDSYLNSVVYSAIAASLEGREGTGPLKKSVLQLPREDKMLSGRCKARGRILGATQRPCTASGGALTMEALGGMLPVTSPKATSSGLIIGHLSSYLGSSFLILFTTL